MPASGAVRSLLPRWAALRRAAPRRVAQAFQLPGWLCPHAAPHSDQNCSWTPHPIRSNTPPTPPLPQGHHRAGSLAGAPGAALPLPGHGLLRPQPHGLPHGHPAHLREALEGDLREGTAGAPHSPPPMRGTQRCEGRGAPPCGRVAQGAASGLSCGTEAAPAPARERECERERAEEGGGCSVLGAPSKPLERQVAYPVVGVGLRVLGPRPAARHGWVGHKCMLWTLACTAKNQP